MRLLPKQHPGKLLREWMERKRLSVVETASLLEVSTDELSSVLSFRAPLLPALAVRLEAVGWGSAESWAGAQALWDIAEARHRFGVPTKKDDPELNRRRILDLGFDIRMDVPSRAGPTYRPRWAAIVIASPGPDESEERHTRFGKIRRRSGARLEHTVRDAEASFAVGNELDLSDGLRRLLIDPTVRDVECALRDVSAGIYDAYPSDIGLDLFFAGHGEEETGNLVLKDGTLSPKRLLELQACDVGRGGVGRIIRVCLDSCYSGAFLLSLATEALDAVEGFRLDDGFASCLPDETCFEMDTLQHGVFTFTRLHPGNAHVDGELFNRAIVENDTNELAKGLQGLVGMTSNPSAFLTEGRQFSMTLYKHEISVEGGFATVDWTETNDYAETARLLSDFKRAGR